MPIRPENRERYPADWPMISRSIRARANHRCEKCSVPNGVDIYRGVMECGQHVWRLSDATVHEGGFSAEDGKLVMAACWDVCDWRGPTRVVLTVAHLDHQPENCDPDNLRAWCQRCHNKYDAPMRAAGIAQRRREGMALGDMFEAQETGTCRKTA